MLDDVMSQLEQAADEEESVDLGPPPETLAAAAFALEAEKKAKESLEERLKAVNANIARLERETIPDLMNKAGLVHNGKGNFTTATGGKIALRNEMHVGVNKEDEGQLFSWLRESGDSSLIRETVHPSTLKSHVRTLVSQGVKIPGFISTFIETKAVLTRGRKES